MMHVASAFPVRLVSFVAITLSLGAAVAHMVQASGLISLTNSYYVTVMGVRLL